MSQPVTAVVTTHDARDTLTECLRSLHDELGIGDILVIDSGSADGCVDGLEAAWPRARVVRLGSNRGPCATRNLGLQLAATERVLFLDDDMVIEPGVVAALAAALDADAGAALAGPSIVFADRPNVIQYAGGRAHFGGLPHLLRLGEAPPGAGAPEAVDILTAGCLMADRARVLAAGGFDEDFFFLAEDVDLCLRLRQRGARVLLVPGVTARNVGGSAELSLKDAAYPARRVELHSRNRWLLIAKLYDRWTLFLLMPALVLYEVAWFAFAVAAGQARAYLRGKRRALGVMAHAAFRKRTLVKQVGDRLLLGAPPMTFTQSALAQPLARRGAAILDGSLRMMWHVVRGAVT